MLNRSLWMQGNSIVRVLDEKENMVLVIDCAHLSMPRWETLHILQRYQQMDETDWKRGGCFAKSIDELSHQAKQIMHERFTIISSVLPFVGDERKRTQMIAMTSEIHGVSQKSVRRYLCKYLAFQSILALAPGNEKRKPDLSKDEKNIRWALNKLWFITAIVFAI